MKDLNKKDLKIIAQIKPSEFAERYCGMKLFSWQKEWIDSYPKITHYMPSRWNGKRLIQFYQMCNTLYYMKDNDLVIVWTGEKQKLMNKDEFADYLMTDYWR